MIYFAAMMIPLIMPANPVISIISLAGAAAVLFMTVGGKSVTRELAVCAAIFAVMTLVNPLFVHRGSTPLFFLNGRAITKEALLYGASSALRIVTALIWCRSFSVMMTSERLFCITGKLSPKITAMLSSAVRFIPEMLSQGRKIDSYSVLSGKFSEASLFSRFRRIMAVFSSLVTWSIENAVCTADSMKARGFELKGRTAYTHFRFAAEDAFLIILSVISALAAVLLVSYTQIEFYPVIDLSKVSATALSVAGGALTAAMLFPVIFTAVIAIRRKGGLE